MGRGLVQQGETRLMKHVMSIQEPLEADRSSETGGDCLQENVDALGVLPYTGAQRRRVHLRGGSETRMQ